jgi:hypothetical protein
MKLISFLSVAAALAAATFALGLAFGTFAVTAYTLAMTTCLALIVTSDYGPRRSGYAAGRLTARAVRERLPLAV